MRDARTVGYTVIAFTQTVSKKVDAKTQPNILDPLLLKLKERQGVVFLKRLNIVIDEDSEKGFGLVCYLNAATTLLKLTQCLYRRAPRPRFSRRTTSSP